MRALHYFIPIIFVFAILGATDKLEQTGETLEKTGSATFAFCPDSCSTIQSDDQIAIFDTTDCVCKIFFDHKKLEHIDAEEARLRQNVQKTSISTMFNVSRNDSMLRSESYYNNLIGLGFKKYYKSGQLRASGFEIGNGKVGKWMFFSTSGKLDSIVDYSSHLGMSYCEFFEIARAFGMVGENSRMPERKRFFEIVDSLGLKSCNPNMQFSNPYWRNYDLYPIPEEEKNGRFECEITFSKHPISRAWTVEKSFRITNKLLCFYLSFYPETKEVCIYECHSVQ